MAVAAGLVVNALVHETAKDQTSSTTFMGDVERALAFSVEGKDDSAGWLGASIWASDRELPGGVSVGTCARCVSFGGGTISA